MGSRTLASTEKPGTGGHMQGICGERKSQNVKRPGVMTKIRLVANTRGYLWDSMSMSEFVFGIMTLGQLRGKFCFAMERENRFLEWHV